MKRIFHLSSCDTCKRILKELQPLEDFELQDIKTEAITPEQLEAMVALSGSYESLFSKRARLYQERKLKDQNLTETDYKALILEQYTFLKRPVILMEDAIFIGNSKSTIAKAKEKIHS
ncbi:Arsenate reductase, glutaredoxin family [Arenibacter nanhaiticus]|uniref:Arsenate reductase, glutaredoxin family n=1 Tax=Arenibacter nanhaiticus TaxID=558155 RepID=A0A1M6D425_9FLAO|nr:ArsC/Spx/MgsR family protein [Arenibacter nanhaiticus]SHI67738.1 Arsenate reductase, glutaredoxin family [Arenibacter nanhaiticus]